MGLKQDLAPYRAPSSAAPARGRRICVEYFVRRRGRLTMVSTTWFCRMRSADARLAHLLRARHACSLPPFGCVRGGSQCGAPRHRSYGPTALEKTHHAISFLLPSRGQGKICSPGVSWPHPRIEHISSLVHQVFVVLNVISVTGSTTRGCRVASSTTGLLDLRALISASFIWVLTFVDSRLLRLWRGSSMARTRLRAYCCRQKKAEVA